MRWLPFLIVLASVTADAKPVRHLDDDEIYKPEPPCPRSSNWTKFARCALKTLRFQIEHDLPGAKLVSYDIAYARGSKRLELYMLVNNVWTKASFYGETNTQSELLAFSAVTGDAYRIDIGFASPTWVTLDQFGTRPALIRRSFTHVCTATGACRSILTSCDLLIHGKAVATFRGVAKWDGRDLRVNGIAQNTNRYCAAPPNLLDPGDAP